MNRTAGFGGQLIAALAIITVLSCVVLSPHYAHAFQPPTHIVVPPTPEPPPPRADAHVLRVCGDPNNLPFSNDKREGFENAIADVVARDLGRRVEYAWQPQRRGFIRTTLKAGRCDAVMGVPAGFELARTTHPYYRSTYVFVSRHQVPPLRSFDDPRLKRLRIGVQITGEDYENPPPAHALAARHLASNVRGFTVYGDYSQTAPQRAVIDAVATGAIDTAVVWGPVAGYFSALEPTPLDVEAVDQTADGAAVPFTFAISIGVRRDDRALADAIDAALGRRRAEIRRILQRFRVPLVEEE
jgi:mxaJ protein